MLSSRCIQFLRHGHPSQVLSLDKRPIDLSKLGTEDVLIRWQASPINPLDINFIEGSYAQLPELPAIGGSEGVGVIERVSIFQYG